MHTYIFKGSFGFPACLLSVERESTSCLLGLKKISPLYEIVNNVAYSTYEIGSISLIVLVQSLHLDILGYRIKVLFTFFF